jgi:hypothetical protein
MEMTADPTLRYKSFLDIIDSGIGSRFGIANLDSSDANFNRTVLFNLTLPEMRRL